MNEAQPRKVGRPKKSDGPRLPHEQVDRLLVFGESENSCGGAEPRVRFPSYRALARRFGVSHSIIADYSKKHDCLRRRLRGHTRSSARVAEENVDVPAGTMGRDDAIRIIDSYLLGFEKAITEGRVRMDSAAGFDTMLRLKEFIQGGDSTTIPSSEETGR
jgi:hypothetical protein